MIVKKNTRMSIFQSKTMSGKKFNKMHPNTTFYKLLHKDFVHFGFEYKHGLNTDTETFTPSGECKKGGLYFTDKENLSFWVRNKHYICTGYHP